MRTIYVVMIVLAFGLTSMMFSLSGLDAGWGLSAQDSDIVSQEVRDQKNNSKIEQGKLKGSAKASNSGDFIGFLVSGGQALLDFASMVVLLPVKLQSLGFPSWFAFPLGVGAQLVASVGIIQFVAGRQWR